MPQLPLTEPLANTLRALPLFTRLPEPVLNAVADMALLQERPAGALIQVEGDEAEAMYLVLRGQVKIMRTAPNGREQVIHIAAPGQYINMVPLLDGGPNPASVQALTDAVLLAFPAERVRGLMAHEPAFTLALLTDLAARQRRLVGLVDELALHTVQGRLAKLLLARAEAAERGVPIPPLTQADMAAQLGTVREMVSRTLRTFEGLGLIEMERGQIVVKDRAGLEEKAEE
jgi:CRP-like cAMP-binding protein